MFVLELLFSATAWTTMRVLSRGLSRTLAFAEVSTVSISVGTVLVRLASAAHINETQSPHRSGLQSFGIYFRIWLRFGSRRRRWPCRLDVRWLTDLRYHQLSYTMLDIRGNRHISRVRRGDSRLAKTPFNILSGNSSSVVPANVTLTPVGGLALNCRMI